MCSQLESEIRIHYYYSKDSKWVRTGSDLFSFAVWVSHFSSSRLRTWRMCVFFDLTHTTLGKTDFKNKLAVSSRWVGTRGLEIGLQHLMRIFSFLTRDPFCPLLLNAWCSSSERRLFGKRMTCTWLKLECPENDSVCIERVMARVYFNIVCANPAELKIQCSNF